MNDLDFKLEYQIVDDSTQYALPVIVVAAGNSTRMCGRNKQLLSLCGTPTIIHTLLAFERSNLISNIVLVTRKEDVQYLQELIRSYSITKLSDIVEGGDTRQKSVLNGLKTIKNSEYVLIHDGARPLVSDDVITRVCENIHRADGVICGIPITDTLKKIDDTGVVVSTINRINMISVQTPQAVKYDIYIKLLSECDASLYTDDASLLEERGYKVICVDGDKSNIKITTNDDIALAEYYLENRGEI